MKKSIPCWQMVGFIVTAVLGTLLHFLFDWAGQNILAAVFSAVNESIWEHRKLLFYPMFLFAMLEYHFWGKKYKNFWCIKLMGMLFGLALIPVIYYTYTGMNQVSMSLDGLFVVGLIHRHSTDIPILSQFLIQL